MVWLFEVGSYISARNLCTDATIKLGDDEKQDNHNYTGIRSIS